LLVCWMLETPIFWAARSKYSASYNISKETSSLDLLSLTIIRSCRHYLLDAHLGYSYFIFLETQTAAVSLNVEGSHASSEDAPTRLRAMWQNERWKINWKKALDFSTRSDWVDLS
jgi:hypothetical protein